jgi:hypothetical protein
MSNLICYLQNGQRGVTAKHTEGGEEREGERDTEDVHI